MPELWKFTLSQGSEHLLGLDSNKNTNQKGRISHYIRTIQRQEKWPSLDSKKLARLENENNYPSPTQQAINLISWIGKNIAVPEEMLEIAPKTHQAMIGARDPDGIQFVLDYLFENKLINGNEIDDFEFLGVAAVTLSFAG